MTWSKRSCLLVLPFVVACIATPLLAQATPVKKLYPELAFVCEWEPRPPTTKRVIVDLSLGRGDYNRKPTAEDGRAVQAVGGRVLYQFRVALLRAELDTSAVRALVKGRAAIASAAFTVPDPTKFDARVQIFYRRAITDTDKEALRALGVLEVDQAPNPVLEASVPDSLIPLIAALPGVQYVRATGWGCAAPARGERIRPPVTSFEAVVRRLRGLRPPQPLNRLFIQRSAHVDDLRQSEHFDRMRQVRRQVEPVPRPEVDRLRAGRDPQKTLDDPARFGKRVRVLGHPRAREIRPPRGDHAFALEHATQRGHLQRPELRVPGARGERHDTKRGAPTRTRRAIRMIAPAYNR